MQIKLLKEPRMKTNKLLALIIFLTLLCSVFSSPSLSPAAGSRADRSNRHDSGIAFNFVDVEIPAVIKFISEITGNNFLFDERIKGKITIIAPTQLSIDEAFNLFTSVLSLKGFTIIPSGPKTYKIIPSVLAKQSGLISEDDDIPVNEGYITKLIPLEHIKAAEALQFLRPIIARDGHISSFGPRNMLIVVDSGINIDKVMSILRLIDKPSIEEEEAAIHVYFLEHADAEDLSKVLQGIIKDLQTSYKAAQRTKQPPGNSAAPVLSVTPDKATNSLVIVAPSEDYKNILQVVKTLDKKRKQVYVEAMIIEASMDRLKDLGTKWRAMATHKGEPIVIGGVGNVNTASILDIIAGLSGFSAGGLGNFLDIPITSISDSGTVSNQTLTAPGFAALFSINEFKDVVNVLSTPQILTSDNEEAEILVGENVPFISQRERDVTTTNTVLNSIERTDVGIKLKLTPQITEGDYVKLDIFQEISSVKSASEDILTSVGPTTTKRATKTSVVVKDGSTVVIGGLMQEREEEALFKIPLLGDIPILGWLFKFRSVSVEKRNLLIFLSPHVVKETPVLAEITERKHRDFIIKEKFYRQGELLVKFNEDVSIERAREILSRMYDDVIKYFDSINVFHIRIDSGMTVEEGIEAFSSLPEVQYAEPNYKSSIQSGSPGTRKGFERTRPAPSIDLYNEQRTLPDRGYDPVHDTDQELSSFHDDPGAAENPFFKSIPPDLSELDKKKFPVGHNRAMEGEAAAESSQPGSAGSGRNLTAPAASLPDLMPVKTDDIIEPGQTNLMATKNEGNNKAIHIRPSETVSATAGNGGKPSSQRNYDIQVGAWKNSTYSTEAVVRLKTRYPGVFVVRTRRYNKVRIPGTMSQKGDALLLKDLREHYGLNPILVKSRE